MDRIADRASGFLERYAAAVIVAAAIVTALSVIAARGLSVSTKLEALMPEAAPSVKTLETAMTKAGSFASIQVVMEGEDKRQIESALFILEAVTRPLAWSDSVQYFEDISVLERHKLLQLEVPALEQVEATLEQKLLAETARGLSEKTGIPISITLVGGDRPVSSRPHKAADPTIEAALEETIETERRFVSDDGQAQALVIWPKPGHEGLGEAKKMISDISRIITALELNAPRDGLRVGIAGRISNKVIQYDAVMRDVVVGLGSAISLIMLLLLAHYRRFVAVPLILLPLLLGISWTIGLTAVVVGGLNLITIFLALILFGLGIDFGIHNLSRYAEARGDGLGHRQALAVIIGHTGKASLYAALTTSAGFFALLLTEFRAFREFGFIAGSGVLLILIAMYTVFPALLSLVQTHCKWPPTRKTIRSEGAGRWLLSARFPLATLAVLLPVALLACVGALGLEFEKNFRNIQADKSPEQAWATGLSKSIFKGGHDRAVLVVDSLKEVEAIERYFEDYAARDQDTPTIAKITSVRDFVPDRDEQAARLRVIDRMWRRMQESGPVPTELEDKTKYLQIDELTTSELPPAMRRVFLGNEAKPGYLMYIYNAVTMDDADLARQFYDDAAEFTVDGKTYNPASEAFIFVEMLALMKADAVRAVALVIATTALMVFAFTRSWRGTAIILLPTAVGLLVTLSLMALTGLRLSVINMVILPSLVGISVDNGIHIYERFRDRAESVAVTMVTTGRAASITTLTTLIGFGGLVTASMGGLRSMGYLALIGFTACLLMTWALLPALLQLSHRRAMQPKTSRGLKTA